MLWLGKLPSARLIFHLLALHLVFKISSLLDNGSSELEREGFSYNQELMLEKFRSEKGLGKLAKKRDGNKDALRRGAVLRCGRRVGEAVCV